MMYLCNTKTASLFTNFMKQEEMKSQKFLSLSKVSLENSSICAICLRNFMNELKTQIKDPMEIIFMKTNHCLDQKSTILWKE